MALPYRKRLRLRDYDYSRDGAYFLTICTKGKACVLSEIAFDSEGVASVQLKPYGKIAESYLKTVPGIEIYVIMPNHVHLIVRAEDGRNITTTVRSLKTLVTKQIGESIWQTSYYDHIIRNEKDFEEKWRYIEDNPRRWIEDEYNPSA